MRGALCLVMVYAAIVRDSFKRTIAAILSFIRSVRQGRANRGPGLHSLVFQAAGRFAHESISHIEDHREDLVDHLWGL